MLSIFFPSLSKQRVRLFRIDTLPYPPPFFKPIPAKSNDKLSYFPDVYSSNADAKGMTRRA